MLRYYIIRKIKTFSRKEIAKQTDLGDNFEGFITDALPRNALNKIAQEIGVKYYLVLDDDYTGFNYRRIFGNTLKGFKVKSLKKIIEKCNILE